MAIVKCVANKCVFNSKFKDKNYATNGVCNKDEISLEDTDEIEDIVCVSFQAEDSECDRG